VANANQDLLTLVRMKKAPTNDGLRQAQEFAAGLLDDPDYQASLKMRLNAGLLPPALEVRLYEYRYGKPVDKMVDLSEQMDLSSLSLEELATLRAEADSQLKAAMRDEDKDDEGAQLIPKQH
jgi:hypothetical protein